MDVYKNFVLVIGKGKVHPVACQGDTEGGRGMALPILDPGTRRWWVVCVTPQLLYHWEKAPLLIVQEVVWASGPVWMGSNP
jgi:hypothetical protein